MTPDVVLAADGLAKRFCAEPRRALRYAAYDLAGELGMPRREGLRRGEHWAVDDVSFELRRGEALGIVGDNGAGKSTLLKMVSGLLKPDRGTVRVHGEIEALIELGTGFDPQLTGRENVALRAALRGLGREGSRRLLDAVEAFSELGDAIDAPMGTYSSGMKARLAYSVAAGLEPDVLLVDEALAVGDIAFQRKCIAHLRGHIARGGALLLVSHNVNQIQTVCERGILLDRGTITFAGTAVDTLNRMFDTRLAGPSPDLPQSDPDGPVAITRLTLEPVGDTSIVSGGAVRVTMHYRSDEAIEGTWGFSVWTPDLWMCVTAAYDTRWRRFERGEGVMRCVVPHLPLVGGRYVIRAGIFDRATSQNLATYGWREPALVHVRPSPGGMANMAMAMNQLVTVEVDWD